MTTQSKRGGGCLWYCIPLLLVLVGVTLPFIPGLKRAQQPTYVKRFLAPGSTEVQVTQPGGYTLWIDNRTTFEGRFYSSSENLPSGSQITLQNKGSAETVEMSRAVGAHVTVSGEERHSVASFNVSQPGKYELTVTNLPQAAVFSFRQDWFLGVARQTVLFGLGGALIIVSAIVLVVVIFVWRRRR